MEWAKCIETGLLIRPFNANKIKHYKCIECNENLIFKKGKIRAEHFSHKSNFKILDKKCSSGETFQHKLGKKLIVQNKNTVSFKIVYSCGHLQLFSRFSKMHEEFTIKCRESTFRLDVGAFEWLDDKRTEHKIIAAIEVLKTHQTTDSKRQSLRASGIHVIEIKAEDIIKKLQFENINNINNNEFLIYDDTFCNECVIVKNKISKVRNEAINTPEAEIAKIQRELSLQGNTTCLSCNKLFKIRHMVRIGTKCICIKCWKVGEPFKGNTHLCIMKRSSHDPPTILPPHIYPLIESKNRKRKRCVECNQSFVVKKEYHYHIYCKKCYFAVIDGC